MSAGVGGMIFCRRVCLLRTGMEFANLQPADRTIPNGGRLFDCSMIRRGISNVKTSVLMTAAITQI